jgi:hypothetical protein
MTVVATFISQSCTVHASDSLLTAVEADGSLRFIEWEQTKIVQVRAWNGAIAYYGLAGWENGWQTLTWLREQAALAGQYASAQAFAEHLASGLQAELLRLGLVGNRAVGVGLHFSAYERVEDRSVPELFHIRNVQDPTYATLFPEGVRVTRETWGVINGQPSALAHGDRGRRLQVHQFVRSDGWLRFNNGDPGLFNTVANALQGAVLVLSQRGQLRPLGVPEYTAIAHRSVALVAQLQGEIGRPNARRVGGRIHNLAITPAGQYSSTTGDTT